MSCISCRRDHFILFLVNHEEPGTVCQVLPGICVCMFGKNSFGREREMLNHSDSTMPSFVRYPILRSRAIVAASAVGAATQLSSMGADPVSQCQSRVPSKIVENLLGMLSEYEYLGCESNKSSLNLSFPGMSINGRDYQVGIKFVAIKVHSSFQ